MSKKPMYGICRICGKNEKLTFEHVPPESAFNNQSVRMITGDKLIKSVTDENILPWEVGQEQGRIQQRGRGGYYLCVDCNSKTGQWYVPEYSKFVSAIHNAIQEAGNQEYQSLGLRMKGIRPLPIFKQIMTMFCDINNGLMGDDSLREYLLDRDRGEFKKERYHLYAHIHSGALERMNGISVQHGSHGIVTITEITTYPVGFTLYIDMPKTFKPEGVELTIFSEYKYNDEIDIEIIIPKLESNTIFSGDYRTKKEIVNHRG